MSSPVPVAPPTIPVRSRRGLGITLIVIGALLAVPWAVTAGLCGASVAGACPPAGVPEVLGFVGGVGLTLMVFGPLLVFTRWQYARRLGICPACGADTGGPTRFCPRCGRRLSARSS